MQDCSNSIANALELLQSCTKSSMCPVLFQRLHITVDLFNQSIYAFRITDPLWGQSTDVFPNSRCWLTSCWWNEQSSCRWFETPWRSCDVTVMYRGTDTGFVEVKSTQRKDTRWLVLQEDLRWTQYQSKISYGHIMVPQYNYLYLYWSRQVVDSVHFYWSDALNILLLHSYHPIKYMRTVW